MQIDVNWVKTMLRADIESYLFAMWNNHEDERKYYLNNLKNYSFTFSRLRIPVKILFDDDYNLPCAVPYGFSVDGEKTEVFYDCRANYERIFPQKKEAEP